MVSIRTSTTHVKKVKPFVQGFKGFWEGNLSNPYLVNTKDHRDWEAGFNKAYFKNLDNIAKKEGA